MLYNVQFTRNYLQFTVYNQFSTQHLAFRSVLFQNELQTRNIDTGMDYYVGISQDVGSSRHLGQTWTDLCIHEIVHLCICTFVHSCICAIVYLCICAFVHLCIWHIHTHTHTYIHTCLRQYCTNGTRSRPLQTRPCLHLSTLHTL